MTHHPTKYQTFTTEVGTFVIWANSKDQVGLRTEWEHNRNASTFHGVDLSEVSETVTLSRVDYTVNVFLTRADKLLADVEAQHQPWRCHKIHGTTWAVDSYDSNMITRHNWQRYSDSHGTPAAHEALTKYVLRPFAQWLDSDEGRAFVSGGDTTYRANTLWAIEAKLDELAELRARLLRIRKKLTNGQDVTKDDHNFARYVRIDEPKGA
jgi:hypothetical protein